MSEIVFNNKHIQTGDRIKIPQAIIDTLKLKKGDRIRIKFDVDKRKIIVEQDNKINNRRRR